MHVTLVPLKTLVSLIHLFFFQATSFSFATFSATTTTMADHHHHPTSLSQTQTTPRTTTSSSLLRKLRHHVANSNQLFGVLTLLITGSILLLLTGLTIVGSVLGLILFAPLIIVTSPIWIPLCAVLFLVTAMFLSMCGFGIVVLAVLTWMYRYFKGLHHPPGSNRVSHALNRVKERAGNLNSKGLDAAAPGA